MSSRIRVLQIVTRLVTRGVPRHVLDLATHLDPERFEVEVLAGRGEPDEGSLWEEASKRGVVCHYVEPLQRAVSPRRDLVAYRAIAAQVRSGGYDIVHTHISKAGVLGRWAAHRAGVPVVVHTFHGRVAEVGGVSLAGRLFLGLERRAAKLSNRLVAVSEDVRQHLLALGVGLPGQYRVIPNGIDLSYYDPARPYARPPDLAGSPIVGTVASMTREKGMDVLLAATAHLVEDLPQVMVCLVGDGPLRLALEKRARSANLANVVHFAGVAPDVRPYLAAFDVLVLPSTSEGMGRVLMEAMAMGTPVVASRTGGIPEIVDHGGTGILVDPGDPIALARALAELIAAPEQRAQLASRARRRVEGAFSVEGMAQAVGRAYEDLLTGTA